MALASAAAALAVVGGGLALHGLVGAARAALPLAFPDAPVGIPGSVATAAPALAGPRDRTSGPALMGLTVAALAIHLWRSLGARWQKAALAVGLLVCPVVRQG